MNKDDFIKQVAQSIGLTQSDIQAVLEKQAEVLRGQLTGGHDLSLPGIGKFSVKQRPARKGRNPSTGAEIEIAAKTVVQFKPAKELRDAVA